MNKTNVLILGQDSSYLSRTNGHSSPAFRLGELVSIKFPDGTRKLCQVVKTAINYGGQDSIELIDEKGQLHCRHAEEVGKIDLLPSEAIISEPSKYHQTLRMENDNYRDETLNSNTTVIANSAELSSRSLESLEIEELRRCCRFTLEFIAPTIIK